VAPRLVVGDLALIEELDQRRPTYPKEISGLLCSEPLLGGILADAPMVAAWYPRVCTLPAGRAVRRRWWRQQEIHNARDIN